MSGAFEIEGGVLRKYHGSEEHVSIPEGVTEIGHEAFRGCTALASVALPEGVTQIGEWAFMCCKSLATVSIPDSLTEIGMGAFSGCDALASVALPKGVKKIGAGAFSPSPVTIVCPEGSGAHRHCVERHIPFVFDYQFEAFGGLLPQGFEKLASPFMADEEGPYVFVSYSHRDREQILPVIKELYEEGWRIWYDEGLTIGDSYDETLEAHVRDCSAFLLFVTPNSIQSPYIEANEVPWAVAYGKPIVECTLEGEGRYPIRGGSALAVVSPSSIGTALERVDGLVRGAPREARGITVVVDPAARSTSAGGGYACCLYSKDGAAIARAIMLEARRAGCVLRDAVEEGMNPEMLRRCACLVAFLDRAFLRDVSLTWALASKYRAGKDVAVCVLEDVEDVELPERLAGLEKEHWLVYSHGIKVDLNTQLARHLQRLGCRDASALPGFEYEEAEGGIVITRYVGLDPSPRIEASYGGVPVVAIAGRAFQGCVRLKEVAFPEGVTEIGASTFSGCAALASVSIPDGVTRIGRGAFFGCKSLASISIPGSVQIIDWEAFNGCKSLASVTVPDGVTVIDEWVFKGCEALASVSIPSSVTEIGWEAFKGCKSLASISIHEGVTEIGEGAFSGCESLVVTCPQDSFAWSYCKENGISVEPKLV
ncbi:MAG: leucine-rich repeat protein [Eggerthellaceae bacterium]|nr:leucine-rich repeat protein [Eggerthellaceae bacterium]